jgi:hypothetical protein
MADVKVTVTSSSSSTNTSTSNTGENQQGRRQGIRDWNEQNQRLASGRAQPGREEKN